MQKIQERMQKMEHGNYMHTPSQNPEHMVPRCNYNSKSEATAQIMKCECLESQGTLKTTAENKYYCVAPVVVAHTPSHTPSN